MGIFDRIAAKATPYEDEADYEAYDQYADDEYYEDEAQLAPLHSIPSVPEVARIVTVWVTDFKEVKDFATEYRQGLPVILNLSDASNDDRKRIVDFALGLVFGLEGAFSRISEDVFLLTPQSVKLDSMGAEEPHNFG
ncbi:cell division protein SepF [Arcanobacterium pinnipediorum]|uniref:Cell division protein SepF n=1 Tax=Arcanobacterium pinnipediorum TaxID=1503041 RepID=A0ABY5AJT6_9ACTO|nr:cell division protein SepF [Arcanobacterium pinnipediorum]USR80036.1 cell division protein SepF [Arcanobacterium pinnipediorum]